MPIPVPSVGQPVFQTWGKAVADNLNSPKRFAAWRTGNQTGLVDGANQVLFDNKDDPYGMMDTASSFKAPVAGLVLINAMVNVSCTGTGNWYTYARLGDAALAEVKRGASYSGSAPAMQGAAVGVTALVPVVANQVITFIAVISAAGLVKTIAGTKSITYFEGCYIGTSYP